MAEVGSSVERGAMRRGALVPIFGLSACGAGMRMAPFLMLIGLAACGGDLLLETIDGGRSTTDADVAAIPEAGGLRDVSPSSGSGGSHDATVVVTDAVIGAPDVEPTMCPSAAPTGACGNDGRRCSYQVFCGREYPDTCTCVLGGWRCTFPPDCPTGTVCGRDPMSGLLACLPDTGSH